MQSKVRTSFATKYSKVDVLINFWDKMINELAHKSEKMMDHHIIGIINRIILVPKEVRSRLL